MGWDIYVILLKKMACKNGGLLMEGDYEKKNATKSGMGGI